MIQIVIMFNLIILSVACYMLNSEIQSFHFLAFPGVHLGLSSFPFFSLSLDHPREIVDPQQGSCCLVLQRAESIRPVQDHAYEYSYGCPSPQARMGGSKGVRSPTPTSPLLPFVSRVLVALCFSPSSSGWLLGLIPIRV